MIYWETVQLDLLVNGNDLPSTSYEGAWHTRWDRESDAGLYSSVYTFLNMLPVPFSKSCNYKFNDLIPCFRFYSTCEGFSSAELENNGDWTIGSANEFRTTCLNSLGTRRLACAESQSSGPQTSVLIGC